ncbi:zinc finger protein [Lentzea sp. JNUCC 0626]|uniref:zinc finger protein n=1 Tax=Lentzea sp. JNUCC 0626 TaxID=3367513 RepID=UPI003749BDA0
MMLVSSLSREFRRMAAVDGEVLLSLDRVSVCFSCSKACVWHMCGIRAASATWSRAAALSFSRSRSPVRSRKEGIMTTTGQAVPINLSGRTPPEPFRWCPFLGARHAIPRRHVPPGGRIDSLCDEALIVPHVAPPKYPDWLWPECPECDRKWRQAMGRPQRQQSPVPTGTSGVRP